MLAEAPSCSERRQIGRSTDLDEKLERSDSPSGLGSRKYVRQYASGRGPYKLNPKLVEDVRLLAAYQIPKSEIAKRTGVSATSIRRILGLK